MRNPVGIEEVPGPLPHKRFWRSSMIAERPAVWDAEAMRGFFLVLLLGATPVGAAEKAHLVQPSVYSAMCDASAAVAASSNLFVAASDEDNVLRVYQSDHPGPPIKSFDFNAFLEIAGKSPEADLEGAALLGNRAFWIGSHGRNKDGKQSPNRCRLFATDITVVDGEPILTPVGRPYKRLLEDLIADSRFNQFHLAEAASLAPKDRGGFNIEGLSATPKGELLLGFRNPIPNGQALLIPLVNPNEVIEGRAARFDPAILLELGGLGIRDMSYSDGTYIIIAGGWRSGGDFQLYRWAGHSDKPEPIALKHFSDYTPEAIILYPGRGLASFQILSDDGTRPVEGIPCKQVSDSAHQTFRSFWISIFIANWPSLSYCELTVVSVIRKSRFAWCLGMPQIPLPPLTEISVLTGKS